MFSDDAAVNLAAGNALRMMRDSGFELAEKVEVLVDPELPFMGYSTRRRGNGPVIVVSGLAVKSGLIEGLLVHEMCHVYRTEKNHPSHNNELLNRVGYHALHEHQLTKDYQIRTVQQAVNHIQDLYADDISFQVFNKTQAFTREQAFNFFLDWIQDEPVKSKSEKARWLNVGTMLNNCFAISNMQRHGVKDIDSQAESKVQKFLSKVDNRMKEESAYFRKFMTSLKEDVTEDEFEKDLTEYLTRIITLATTT